jgi:glucose-6-phosphate isomerase, archaeal
VMKSSEPELRIENPGQIVDLDSWAMEGAGITVSERRLKHLAGVFADEGLRASLDPETIVYRVQAFFPVSEGTPGGLFFGSTTLQPGKVGDEYFMTRGHFHATVDRGEYYWGVSGEGILLLMDANRVMRAEKIFRGSVHYIAGQVAHRIANTGPVPLAVGACWHSDAGHNYEEIDRAGFPARLLEVGGLPRLVRGTR